MRQVDQLMTTAHAHLRTLALYKVQSAFYCVFTVATVVLVIFRRGCSFIPMMITPWPLVYTDSSRKIGILLTLARSG